MARSSVLNYALPAGLRYLSFATAHPGILPEWHLPIVSFPSEYFSAVRQVSSQGRVFFRFIDAPFQQDWFIDEHNVVHSEWGRIREHIGAKIQITAQVTS